MKLKQLVEYVVEKLVDKPDQVVVEAEEVSGATMLRVRVASEDLGKVIGKEGKVARTIRSMIHVAANQEGKRVTVEVERD